MLSIFIADLGVWISLLNDLNVWIIQINFQKSSSSDSMVAMGNMLSQLLKTSLSEAVDAIAIQLTNGFEVNLPSMSGRAIYPVISYFNHSCVPNVAHSHKVTSIVTKKANISQKNGKKHPFIIVIIDRQRSLHHTRGIFRPFHAFVSRALCANAEIQLKSYYPIYITQNDLWDSKQQFFTYDIFRFV